MPGTEDLRRLLARQLSDLRDADTVLSKAWPKLRRLASAKSLKRLCREGGDYTEERIKRLDSVFAILSISPEAKKSAGMRALVQSTLAEARSRRGTAMRDAVILAGIAKISHDGMADYDTAASYAAALRDRRAASLLRRSYREKKDAIREEMAMAKRTVIPALRAARRHR